VCGRDARALGFLGESRLRQLATLEVGVVCGLPDFGDGSHAPPA
jgi:hypothetical protein